MKKLYYILLYLFLFGNISYSQDLFEENKGQYPDNVKYKLDFNSGQIYFENDRFTYNIYNRGDMSGSQAHHAHANTKENIYAHAYQMEFIECNSMPSVYANGQSNDYKNFFLGDRSNWASYVYSYKEIEYQELYDGVDLIIKKVDGGIKYDFIVDEGVNPDKIRMKFIGHNSLRLENDKLILETSLHPIYELAPFAYQEINGNKKEVKIKYILVGDILSFDIGRYNKDYPLIIDPVLIFSTYSGSTSDNWGFTATYDSKGNVYSGGIVCNAGYPTTIGAFQYSFQGGEIVSSDILGWDVALIKYDETGTNRLWATYLGGTTGEEMPHSLVVNELDEIIIYGTTGSSDFPITPTAYQTTFAGGTNVIYDNVIKFSNGIDIYVTKLSEDGSQLLASTYVGGSGNDGLNYKPYINSNSVVLMNGNDSLYYNYADGARGEVIVDDKNDIYVGTSTFSTDFPIVAGLQTTNSGEQEGVVFKLTPDLSGLMWSTYLGGTKDDAIYSVDVNNNYDVYVSGGTVSSDFPTTPGTYSPNFNGGTTDGFVSHISFNGQTLVSSTYYGSDQYDQAYFVRLDHDNNVYLAGQTEATGSTLIFNAAYNTPNSGQFIAKLDPSLTTLDFSTVFGTGLGKPNISITAFAVDVCNRIYLSGWGRVWPRDATSSLSGSIYLNLWTDPNFGTKNMDITANAYQSVTDGQDFYIMVMAEDASSLDYGTFFGEQHSGNYYCGHDHVDGGTARFDKKGNIYQSVCASCGFYEAPATPYVTCNDFPTTAGAWSEDNGGIINTTWVCNNAVFRFSFLDDFTAADFHFPGNGCEPYDVQFVNTSLGSTYFWDFGDGNTSTDDNPSHTYDAGTYTIMLIANDPGTCNLSDTIYKTITVGTTTTEIADVAHICVGGSTPIGISPLPDPNITYTWDNVNTLSDSTISNPIASPTTTTEYNMTASYDACLSLTQLVVVHDNSLNVTAYPDTGICPGEQVTLFANADDSTITYSWYQAGSGTVISTDDTLVVNPTSTTNYLISVNEQFCNTTATDTVEVEIIPLQVALQDTIICLGDTVNIHAYSLIPGDTIDWNWTPTSQIIANADTANPLVAPSVNTTYYLSASNQRNCTLLDSLLVQVDDLQINITDHQDVVCYGECNGSLTVTPDGFAPYSYDWSSSDMDSTTSFLCPGSYEVTVTDFIGCEKIIDADITEPTELLASITDVQNTLCGDSSYIGSATVMASQGSPSYSYLWSDGQTENTADSLGYGTYFVTVTDSHACDTVISVFIDDPSDLVISTSSIATTCYNYCDGSAFVAIDTPSTMPYTYLWTTGSADTSISDLCSGVYTITVTDADECMRISHIIVAQPDSIHLIIDSDGIICHGDLATAFTDVISGGTPDYSYLWNTGDTSQTITGLYEGYYWVIATDAHNCKDTTYITLVDPPVLIFDTATVIATCDVACNGIGTVFMDGGIPPYSYIWDNGSTDSVANNLCVGNHTVTVNDANGCVNVLDVDIGYSPDGLIVSAWADDYIIYNDESTILHTVDGDTYNWSPSISLDDGTIQNPVASPDITTIYYVTVTDENGCTNIDTVEIKILDVICGEPYIYVPNAFTPNGDGNNDILYAYGDIIDDLYFAVYDRWGELMFETTDITKGWDGTYRGNVLDPAVFVYYIKAICRDKETFIKKGNVTLIR